MSIRFTALGNTVLNIGMGLYRDDENNTERQKNRVSNAFV